MSVVPDFQSLVRISETKKSNKECVKTFFIGHKNTFDLLRRQTRNDSYFPRYAVPKNTVSYDLVRERLPCDLLVLFDDVNYKIYSTIQFRNYNKK